MIRPVRSLTHLRGAAALALALACATAVAAPAPDAAQSAEVLTALHNNLRRSFELDKELALDATLRAQADEISAAHLARFDKVLSAWLAEERAAQTGPGKTLTPGEQYGAAVWARTLNELALWQIEPGDAHYERATLAVLKSAPTVCNLPGDQRVSDFAARLLRIQAMPASQRGAALAGERKLLAHWGQARPAPAAWPVPLPQDAATDVLKRGPVDGKRRVLALPPLLASELLGDQKTYAAMSRPAQCLLQQWWLQESLRQGATPSAALNAFRYGTLLTGIDRFPELAPATAGKTKPPPAMPAYPPLATRFLITGVITMRVQLDAAGKPVQASVAERKLVVPGIRGVRPVAFENTFDAPSLENTLHGHTFDKSLGTGPHKFQIIWKLDDGADQAVAPPAGANR